MTQKRKKKERSIYSTVLSKNNLQRHNKDKTSILKATPSIKKIIKDYKTVNFILMI